MNVTLEAAIAALIRLGAIGYAAVGVVGVAGAAAVLPALSTMSRASATPAMMMAPILGAVVLHLAIGVVAFLCSRPLARFVCAGLEEADA